MAVNVKQTGSKVTIEIDLTSNPTLSQSGKTAMLASTGGNIEIPLKVDGRQIVGKIGVNLFTKDKKIMNAITE